MKKTMFWIQSCQLSKKYKGRMFEVNPINNSLADIRARADSLRGYL